MTRKDKIKTAEMMLNDANTSPLDALTPDERAHLEKAGMTHNGHQFIISTFVHDGDRTHAEKICKILAKLPYEAYLHIITNVHYHKAPLTP